MPAGAHGYNDGSEGVRSQRTLSASSYLQNDLKIGVAAPEDYDPEAPPYLVTPNKSYGADIVADEVLGLKEQLKLSKSKSLS